MKKSIYLLSAGLLLMTFTNCANGKKMQENAPMALAQAYYTDWSAGVKEGDSGFTLFIPAEDKSGIHLDSVYFRGRKAVIEKSGAESNLYVAYFKTSSGEGKPADVVMHIDPKKEYGNKPPRLPEKIPFELQKGEAVVKYIKNGKENFFRITGIEKRESSNEAIKKPENIRH